MHQTSLALASVAAASAAAPLPGDTIGFDIGWEHAQHGLVPPPELLLEGTAISQGWRAARAVLGQRRLGSTRAQRQWLAVRILAWREGAVFDTSVLGPAELAQLEPGRCPVRCQQLGGAATGDDTPVVFRLRQSVGYRPGNLVVLSRKAFVAAQDSTVADALRQAHAAEARGMEVRGLHAGAWRRLAVLLSFAQDLAPAQTFTEAARLPLLLLPPPGVVPVHTVQRLQWQLTLQFQQPGWSARMRALAATLPREAQRTDFHLFVSALASRVVEAQSRSAGQGLDLSPLPLEEGWLHERVLRRWRQLTLGLGDVGCQALLHQLQAQQGAADLDLGGACPGQGLSHYRQEQPANTGLTRARQGRANTTVNPAPAGRPNLTRQRPRVHRSVTAPLQPQP